MLRLSLALVLALVSLQCSSGSAAETADSLRERSAARLAQVEGEIVAPGLDEPVEILRDKWGVAHIFAQNRHDLFFAQGYVAAQDRLYQIEIWRRTGAGELAEVFGPDYVERDRIARLVRYRGEMEPEWASYSPHTEEIAAAFTAGINAYVDANRDRLPIEFELLDFEPARWEPQDILLRTAGLLMVRNVSQEIMRAKAVAELGVETARKFLPTDPVRDFAPDPDLDLAGIDDRVLDLYREAVSIPRLEGEGSNNWVVDGTLSSTGKPLLASDPHRPVILPSLRYLVHLNAPGWNVIGSGEPALPGVAIGHNERVGWGFTIVQYDLADLFVEKVDSENPTRYLAGDEWLEMEVLRESIRVRDREEPVEVELKFTRHGPVIWEDPENDRVVALRWAGQEPGTAGYLGSLALDQVEDWQGFVEAMRAWKTPSENMVYADVDGNIGWIPAGLMPIRSDWLGLFPAPGWENEHRWTGFRDVDQLPRRHNPASRYIATANHNILPTGYPHDLGFDWSPDYRFARIDEVLRAGDDFTVEDFQRLQQDVTSLPARRLTAMVAELPEAEDEDARQARELLADWDNVLTTDSAAAALFEVWRPMLEREYVEAAAPAEAQELVARYVALPTVLAGLEKLPREERARVFHESLAQAMGEARELLGDDPSAWRWGDLHQIEFRHPLANTSERAAAFNLGPVERPGDGYTPNATSGPGFRQSSGASYRHVLDFADWDRSVFTSTPGQSGQPGSPHYGDLLEMWAAGEYAPLLFTREAIEQNLGSSLILRPE